MWLVFLGIVFVENISNNLLHRQLLKFAHYLTLKHSSFKIDTFNLQLNLSSSYCTKKSFIVSLLKPILLFYSRINTLESIEIAGIRLYSNDIQILNDIFLSNRNLKRVHFEFNVIGEKLSTMQFKHLHNLESLTVKNNYIRDEEFRYFLYFWKYYFAESLKYLNFSRNFITDFSSQIDFYCIKCQSCCMLVNSAMLETLIINQNILTRSSLMRFQSLTNLKNLEFSNDLFSHESQTDGAFLLYFISYFPKLEHLKFSAILTSEEEFNHFIFHLKSLTSFKSLSVSSIHLSLAHIELLCRHLTNLERLTFSYCSIMNEGFKLIMKKMKNLKELSLQSNDLGNFTLQDIDGCLPLIQKIDITKNQATSQSWLIFLNYLPSLPYLKHIVISFMSFNNECLSKFFKILPNCHSLLHLELVNFPFSSENELKIIDMLLNPRLNLATLDMQGCKFSQINLIKILGIINSNHRNLPKISLSLEETEYLHIVEQYKLDNILFS